MKNHYETLNLEKNCSTKEIKDSFIKLSKKYHPDKNKTSEAHKKFVEINEAYSILSKSDTRHIYDESLTYGNPVYNVHRSGTRATTPNDTYSERWKQNNYRNYQNNTSYFTRSKLSGVLLCFVFIFFGSGIQVIAEARRRRLKSQEIARWYKENKERIKFEKEKKRRSKDFFIVDDTSLEDLPKKQQ